ncbi:MAG: hypothetical protein ABI635_08430 [Actinomycetota bacterium]
MTLLIDLNSVRGDRLVRYLDLMEFLMAEESELNIGSAIRVMDEEGDAYIATIIESDPNGRLKLEVNFETLIPATTFEPTQSSASAPSPERYYFMDNESAAPQVRANPNARPVVLKAA